MFDHVPEQRERWLRVRGWVNVVNEPEKIDQNFRIICRDCLRQNCLYMWESTLAVLIRDKDITVCVVYSI